MTKKLFDVELFKNEIFFFLLNLEIKLQFLKIKKKILFCPTKCPPQNLPSLQYNFLSWGHIKREFLTRLSVYSRDSLIIMGNADLNHMAMQADALAVTAKNDLMSVYNIVANQQLHVRLQTHLFVIEHKHLLKYSSFDWNT